MQSDAAKDSAWDFTAVFDLLQSLNSQDRPDPRLHENQPRLPLYAPTGSHGSPSKDAISEQIKGGLGNFSRVWDFLGVQTDTPSTSAPHFATSTAEPNRPHDAYTSDGALYYPRSSKSEYQGSTDRGDLTDSPDGHLDHAQLTRNQRKKLYRKQRRALEAAKLEDDIENGAFSLVSLRKRSRTTSQLGQVSNDKTKEKEAVVPAISSSDHITAEKHAKFYATATSSGLNFNAKTGATNSVKHGKHSSEQFNRISSQKLSEPLKTPQKATSNTIEEGGNEVVTNLKDIHNSTGRHAIKSTKPSVAFEGSLQRPWERNPAGSLALASQSAFLTPSREANHSIAQGAGTHPFATIQQQPNTRLRHEIMPLVNQTSVDRHWALLLKLLHNFPEDRKYLVSPLQLSINMPQPDGIHVFVDASNILIGFYEHLKAARGIPADTRVPRVDLNFHALALLLERRRPVAKRVLAGSSPEIQAYEEARQVGYETCILDKVYKAKELTEKQKRYQSNSGYRSSNGYASGSESAGNGTGMTEPKWVEQGVDEILHLKILESVVDTPIPADAVTRPTMILATGDAAEAEYSAGFRKMVERALRSGWMVEVMAFGRSVSMDYWRMAKLPLAKGGWGERFKIIELDEYAEELFGEAM